MTESRGRRWAGGVTQIRRKRNYTKFRSENLEEGGHMEDRCEGIILYLKDRAWRTVNWIHMARN
jgi:hypothetical protein